MMLVAFLIFLFCHLPAFSEKNEAPSIFTPDQLAALTGDVNQLIGDLISPLSGNPCLKQTDCIAIGAQPISLDRIYMAPYMPSTFHKHWNADCYYRREYLRRHYEGWTFFPHTRLWFDRQKKEVHLITPNAATYDFSIANSKTTLLHPYAISNVGELGIPGGQFDPRNTRITYENNKITVFTPDGSTRYYAPKRGALFLLEKESLPNGKILRFHYTDKGSLSLKALPRKISRRKEKNRI